MINKNSGALWLRAYNTMKSQASSRFDCRWTSDDALTQNGNGGLKCEPKTVTSPTDSNQFSSVQQRRARGYSISENYRQPLNAFRRSRMATLTVFFTLSSEARKGPQKLLSSYKTNRRGLWHGFDVYTNETRDDDKNHNPK